MYTARLSLSLPLGTKGGFIYKEDKDRHTLVLAKVFTSTSSHSQSGGASQLCSMHHNVTLDKKKKLNVNRNLCVCYLCKPCSQAGVHER